VVVTLAHARTRLTEEFDGKGRWHNHSYDGPEQLPIQFCRDAPKILQINQRRSLLRACVIPNMDTDQHSRAGLALHMAKR